MNFLKDLSFTFVFSFLVGYFLLILLTGCSSTGPISEVKLETVQIKYITIPKELLEPCKPNRPITKEDYLKLNMIEREAYLTNYSIHLLSELKICDNKIKQIRLLQEKQSEGKP